MKFLKLDDELPLKDMKIPVKVDDPGLADFSQLHFNQREFIRMLRMNPNRPITEILEKIPISKKSYRRWMEDVNFRRCLYVAYYDVEKYVASRASDLLDTAINTLDEIMCHSNNDNARIAAVKVVLQLPQNPSLSRNPALSAGKTDQMRKVWERAITYREKLMEKPMFEENDVIEGNFTLRSDHEVQIDSETLAEIEAKSKILSDLEKIAAK